MSSYPSASRPRSNSDHLSIDLPQIIHNPLPLKTDLKLFSVLFVLYVIQGIAQGLFLITIPTFLLEKGATFDDISTTTLSYAPFCFKFLLASLLNNNYSRSFGRGKTYLVPSQYCLSALMILFSLLYGENILDIKSLPGLDIISVLAACLLMISDIVMDGWIIQLTKPKNSSSLGTICQSVGATVGFFISFIILLPLSSPEFCKNYIYSTPRDTPILPMHQFIFVFGMMILFTAIYIHFFMKEPKTEEKNQFYSIKKLINVLQLSFENTHFRKLFFTLLTWNMVFGPIHSIFPNLIVSLGVSKELFTGLYAPVILIELGLTIFIGDLCKQYSESKIIRSFWTLRLLITFIVYGALLNVANTTGKGSVLLLFIASLTSQITFTGTNTAFMSDMERVSKETYGAPLLSIFSAIGWISRWITEWGAFTMLDYMNWETLAAYSLVGLIIYAALFLKGPLKVDTTVLKEFKHE